MTKDQDRLTKQEAEALLRRRRRLRENRRLEGRPPIGEDRMVRREDTESKADADR